MLLLLFICFFISRRFPCLRIHIPRIAAAVRMNAVILQIDNACRRSIKKITVMRNHKHASFIGAKIILQPFQHAHVQMVRRFVKKKEIRMTHESSRQINPDLLTAGKRMNIPIPVLFRKTETR